MTINLGLQKTNKFRILPPKQRLSTAQVFSGLLLVLGVAYFNYVPEGKTISSDGLKAGDIAREDIVVQSDISIEDKETTEQNRKKILSSLIPIYIRSQENVDGALIQINDWFTFIREARRGFLSKKLGLRQIQDESADKFALNVEASDLQLILQANSAQRIDVNQLLTSVQSWTEQGILDSKLGMRKNPENSIWLIEGGKERRLVNVDGFLDQAEVRRRLDEWLTSAARLQERERKVVANILSSLIPATITFSQELNQQQERRILESLQSNYQNWKKGQIVVRRGDVVSADQAKQIALISSAERVKAKRISPFYFLLLFWLLAYLFSGRILAESDSGDNRNRFQLVSFFTLLISAAIYRVFLSLMPLVLRSVFPALEQDAKGIFYSIPFGFGAIIIAFLFDRQRAYIFAIANAILGGILCDWSIKFALFVLISNLTVALAIDHYQRLKRSSTLKAGFFWLAPVSALMVFAITVTEGSFNWTYLVLYVGLSVFAAVTASLFANFLISLWEVIFKLVTDLKLVEITNLDLPIFREMLEKAPGTYHHSQMVAALAEAAAEPMALSPLLLRAQALYHDIGKIENPNFFVENHSVYEDPHARIPPQESAKAIISHIDAGLEIATRLKLPPKIRKAITRHHGTKLVQYFFQKAVGDTRKEAEEVNEDIFRYPGPKPQEIEDAVIMLADQVEAAAKSLSSPSDDDIRNVIEQIITANAEENQFEECQGLTFMALKSIAASFFNKLAAIYHQRISYPGFQFTKSRPNGDNHKS